MKWAAAAILALMPAVAWGQNALTQGGAVTTRHLGMFLQDRQLGDVGGLLGRGAAPQQGFGAAPFSITDGNGCGLQFNNAPTTGPYDWFCFGHTAAGDGMLNINGTIYPLLGTGNGSVNGPALTTVNEIASWNNTSGTLLRQGSANMTDNKTGPIPHTDDSTLGVTSSPTITARSIYSWVMCDCSDDFLAFVDTIRGVAIQTSGSTASLVNAVSGYVVGQQPGAGFPVSVALFGVGLADVDGARVWGVNTALSDNRGQTVSSHGTREITGAEFNVNFTSPNSIGFGVNVVSASLAQPTAAYGIACGPLDLDGYAAGTPVVAKWTHCFDTSDQASGIGISIGRQLKNTVPNAPSQVVVLGYSTETGVPQNLSFYANGGDPMVVFQNTEALTTTITGANFIIPASATRPDAITIGWYTGPVPPVTGPPTTGLTPNLESQTVIYQHTNNAGTSAAVFTKGKMLGALPILEVSSTDTVAVPAGRVFVRSFGSFIAGGMPSSCTGYPVGTFWNNAGAVHVC